MANDGFMKRSRRRALTGLLAMVIAGGAVGPALPQPRGALAETRSARIAHNDDGVFLRAEPTFGATVLGTLPEGTVVGLRTDEADTTYDTDGVTRWWPVATDQGDGWVSGFYLDIPTPPGSATGGNTSEQTKTAATSPAESATGIEQKSAAPGAGPILYGTTARIAEVDGVNLREQPAVGSAAVGQLAFDAVVELRIGETDTVYADNGRWWPVRVEGRDGWILGSYLAPADGAAVPQSESPAVASDDGIEGGNSAEQTEQTVADAPGKQAADIPLFSIGAYVAALTEDGTGLNIRADGAPDSEQVGSIPENDVVQVMDGPFLDPTGRGWYLITDGAVSGFVDGGYLGSADQPAAPGDDEAPELQFPEAPLIDLDRDRPGRATGSFVYPVAGFTFTQSFGCSPYWFEPWEPSIGCNYHNGVDLAASMGTPLTASDGGTVEYSGWCDCGLGYYVKIDHGNGYKTVYGHMSELWVSSGERVSQGETIGAMGSTGNSTGPHVHFMVEVNGITDDPLAYLG